MPNDAEEFYRRKSIPGVKAESLTTDRVQDTILTINGLTIGQKTVVFKRGKPVSEYYILLDMVPTND